MEPSLDTPYFKRKEFACKCGCGKDTIDAQLLLILTSLRAYFDSPVIINSANRCEAHNAAVNGSPNSQHLLSKAADIQIVDVIPAEAHELILKIMKGWGGVGFYPNDGFIHIDVRDKEARWVG